MTTETACRGSGLRHRRALLICSLLFVTGPTTTHAANWSVDVGGGANLTFSPATLEITAGDTVTFVNRGGFHNVAADDGSFRCAQGCDGSGGDGNASSLPWSATVTLSTPGSVGYHCEIHGVPGLGMFGTITVDPQPPPPPPSSVDSVPNGGMAFLLLLAGALVLGAALNWRRHGRVRR